MTIDHRTDRTTGDTPGTLDVDAETACIAKADASNRTDLARDLARRVAHLDVVTRQRVRDAILKVLPTFPKGDFKAIVDEERAKAKQQAKQQAQRDADDEKRRFAAAVASELLPPPSDPMATGRVLVDRLDRTDGVPHLCWWRGDFYAWTTSRWAVRHDTAVERWLYLETEHASCENEFGGIVKWAPNRTKVGNLLDAVGHAIVARPWEADDEKCVAVGNGVLDPTTRELSPHTPRRFNLAALPFDYHADAQCPQWLAFLDQVLGHDPQALAFLQEWFGYVVSGRTDLQKMAHLFGARRSGKGTIARILEALLGPDAVASPSLTSLTGQFGEQPLIGKSLAVLSDVSWNARDVGEAVEILKKISGEDSRDVNRKNRETWHGKLGVRFMILGNDAPQFTDASGALVGRMIHVKFTRSFFNAEDPTLTGRLLTELPGILNWALDGLDRLTQRGRFQPPDSSAAAEREIMRGTSPVYGFIDDLADINPDAPPVLLNKLFAVYRKWCSDEEGRDRKATKSVFSRNLRSVGNGVIDVRREMVNGKRDQWVYGLAPKEPGAFDTDDDTDADAGWIVASAREQADMDG